MGHAGFSSRPEIPGPGGAGPDQPQGLISGGGCQLGAPTPARGRWQQGNLNPAWLQVRQIHHDPRANHGDAEVIPEGLLPRPTGGRASLPSWEAAKPELRLLVSFFSYQ